MVYIVLGMHKSGTTLVSKILHESGINMGSFDKNASYDQGNHYERNETNSLNKQILGCGDRLSLDVVNKANIQDILTDNDICDSILNLIDNLNKIYNNWGFKDPRTCLTFPIWEKYIHPCKIIFIYRDPLEVYSHYSKKISPLNLLQKIKNSWKALSAWYIYNVQAYKIARTKNFDTYIIHYSNFMNDENEFEKFEKFLDRQLVDCRKKNMYRSKNKVSILYTTYVLFQKLFLKRDIIRLYNDLKCL